MMCVCVFVELGITCFGLFARGVGYERSSLIRGLANIVHESDVPASMQPAGTES